MGVSGCILKRKEDIDVNKSIEDIKMSAVRAGLLSEMNKKEEQIAQNRAIIV